MEFYVHHEDVRRAQPDWQPRELPQGMRSALWRRLPALARLTLRRFPASVLVQAPGHGEVSAGAGGERLRLAGSPDELAELADRLRRARLGI
jgi:hypothetical protein